MCPNGCHSKDVINWSHAFRTSSSTAEALTLQRSMRSNARSSSFCCNYVPLRSCWSVIDALWLEERCGWRRFQNLHCGPGMVFFLTLLLLLLLSMFTVASEYLCAPDAKNHRFDVVISARYESIGYPVGYTDRHVKLNTDFHIVRCSKKWISDT
jgi:hypothetical protein